MAQLYSTGPALFYVGKAGNATSALFLGTCQESPEIDSRPLYKEVINSIGGSQKFDKSYQGDIVTISGLFNRYNETVVQALEGRPNVFGGSLEGITQPGEVGTLMLTEGAMFDLWIKFPYAAKPAFSPLTSGMLPGYHFPGCTVEGPTSFRQLGTTEKMIRFEFEALRIFYPITGGFLLWDLLGLELLPPIN